MTQDNDGNKTVKMYSANNYADKRFSEMKLTKIEKML